LIVTSILNTRRGGGRGRGGGGGGVGVGRGGGEMGGAILDGGGGGKLMRWGGKETQPTERYGSKQAMLASRRPMWGRGDLTRGKKKTKKARRYKPKPVSAATYTTGLTGASLARVLRALLSYKTLDQAITRALAGSMSGLLPRRNRRARPRLSCELVHIPRTLPPRRRAHGRCAAFLQQRPLVCL